MEPLANSISLQEASAKVKSREELYFAMVANKFHLPKLSAPIVTIRFM